MSTNTKQGPLPANERPTSYPAVGASLIHAHEGAERGTWTVTASEPHSDPSRTRQRAITLRHDTDGRERTFEMSTRNFYFNWTPAS